MHACGQCAHGTAVQAIVFYQEAMLEARKLRKKARL